MEGESGEQVGGHLLAQIALAVSETTRKIDMQHETFNWASQYHKNGTCRVTALSPSTALVAVCWVLDN